MSELDPTSEIERIRNVIDRAVEAIEPGGDPFKVFPNPREADRRDQIRWGNNLTTNQAAELRMIMGEVGVGRFSNVNAETKGLTDDGFVAYTDGGKPNKMIAELNVLTKDVAVRPCTYIISGSDRPLKDDEVALGEVLLSAADKPAEDDEAESGEVLSGVAVRDEHDMAIKIVKAHLEFTELDEAVQLYDDARYSVAYIGTLAGRPVYDIKIKTRDQNGEKQRKVPTQERMQIASQLGEGLPVAFTTGASFTPSAEVAAHNSGVDVVVLSYGTEEMARVEGAESPRLPAVGSIGAEAYKTAAFLANKP